MEDTRINFRLYTLFYYYYCYFFFFFQGRPRFDTCPSILLHIVSNIFPLTFRQWLLNWKNKSRNTKESIFEMRELHSSVIGLWWRAWILKFRIKAVKRGMFKAKWPKVRFNISKDKNIREGRGKNMILSIKGGIVSIEWNIVLVNIFWTRRGIDLFERFRKLVKHFEDW